jgi:hypothetical protein
VLEIVKTETIKYNIKEKYEKYVETLKDTISKFQNEWDTLYESYKSLLEDIKHLIINNEKLKSLVIDLEGKIEAHNKTVSSNDGNIKMQIELLTKHSLSKKTIDWNSQREVMNKSASEMLALNNKLKRIEMQNFTSSSLLDLVPKDMEKFVKEIEDEIDIPHNNSNNHNNIIVSKEMINDASKSLNKKFINFETTTNVNVNPNSKKNNNNLLETKSSATDNYNVTNQNIYK